MTRRRDGTQTRILWLLYCQLYDSPYPTYYLKKTTKNCCFIPIMYGFVCVCCFIDLSNLASVTGRLAARCISFLSACANMECGVVRLTVLGRCVSGSFVACVPSWVAASKTLPLLLLHAHCL